MPNPHTYQVKEKLAQKRRRAAKRKAHDKGRTASAATLALCDWVVMVFLEQHATFAGEELIKTAVFLTVLLSIYAHGFSALPGINWYTKQLTTLDPSAPELVRQTD